MVSGGLGRVTAAPSSLDKGQTLTSSYYVNDLIRSQTVGSSTMTWSLDPSLRVAAVSSPVGTTTVVKQNHYSSDGDSPSWISEDTANPNLITRYVPGMDGQLAVQSTSKTALTSRSLQLVDMHGDVMAVLPITDGASSTTVMTGLQARATDEFGMPLDLTSGGVSANAPPRYGWLGGPQRSGETLGGTILMGVRVYHPATGRFLSTDPVPGGNATPYDYCTGDPINCRDLDGNWGWKDFVGVVAQVAEIAAIIPGPVGLIAGGVSAASYAAVGNWRKAAEVGVIAALSLVGAGVVAVGVLAAVKVASKIASVAPKVARVARTVVQGVKSAAATARGTVAAVREVGSALSAAVRNGQRLKALRLGNGGWSIQAGKVRIEKHVIARVHSGKNGVGYQSALHYHANSGRHKFFTPKWVMERRQQGRRIHHEGVVVQLTKTVSALYAGRAGRVTGRIIEVSTGRGWIPVLVLDGHWIRGSRPWLPTGVTPELAAWVDDVDEASIVQYLHRMGAGSPIIVNALIQEGFGQAAEDGSFDALLVANPVVTSPPSSWIFVFDGERWTVSTSACPDWEPMDASGEAWQGTGEKLQVRLYPSEFGGLDVVVFEPTGVYDFRRLVSLLREYAPPSGPEYAAFVRGAHWLRRQLEEGE